LGLFLNFASTIVLLRRDFDVTENGVIENDKVNETPKPEMQSPVKKIKFKEMNVNPTYSAGIVLILLIILSSFASINTILRGKDWEVPIIVLGVTCDLFVLLLFFKPLRRSVQSACAQSSIHWQGIRSGLLLSLLMLLIIAPLSTMLSYAGTEEYEKGRLVYGAVFVILSYYVPLLIFSLTFDFPRMPTSLELMVYISIAIVYCCNIVVTSWQFGILSSVKGLIGGVMFFLLWKAASSIKNILKKQQ